jgi:hypothetical protein
MPKTYEPIQTYTTTGSEYNFTFSSIPSTYTDLVLVLAGSLTSPASMYIRLNGDSATNYSLTILEGGGASASSSRLTSRAQLDTSTGLSDTSSHKIFTFLNYSNTSTNKTILSRVNAPSGTSTGLGATVGSWRSTAAINSIFCYNGSNQLYNAGTVVTLYGIKAA